MSKTWFRFWSETFLIVSNGDLEDYWTDDIARLICPCHKQWYLYYKTHPRANDNRGHDEDSNSS